MSSGLLLVLIVVVGVAAWSMVGAIGRLESAVGAGFGRLASALEESPPEDRFNSRSAMAGESRSFTDAPQQFTPVPREKAVPRLSPQDIAPNLTRPPRPSGGFGTKIGP